MPTSDVRIHHPTPLEWRIGALALSAIGIIIVGAMIAAFTFQRPDGLYYSFLNHNISELGDANDSRMAVAFNTGMILGGCLLAVAMVMFALRTRTRGVYLATVFGVPGVVGMALVGFFPTSSGMAEAHGIAAAMTFLGALGYSVITTYLLAASSSLRMPRWLCVPCAGPAICVLAFVIVPMRLYPDVPFVEAYDSGRMGDVRPTVWPPSLLEWSILISFLLWILCAAGWLAFARRAEHHVIPR